MRRAKRRRFRLEHLERRDLLAVLAMNFATNEQGGLPTADYTSASLGLTVTDWDHEGTSDWSGGNPGAGIPPTLTENGATISYYYDANNTWRNVAEPQDSPMRGYLDDGGPADQPFVQIGGLSQWLTNAGASQWRLTVLRSTDSTNGGFKDLQIRLGTPDSSWYRDTLPVGDVTDTIAGIGGLSGPGTMETAVYEGSTDGFVIVDPNSGAGRGTIAAIIVESGTGSMTVLASDPADGDVVVGSPEDVTVDFNMPIVASSLQASDLTIDGAAAIGVTQVDDDTAVFELPPDLALGGHTIAIAEGALLGEGDLPIVAFSATFTVIDGPDGSISVNFEGRPSGPSTQVAVGQVAGVVPTGDWINVEGTTRISGSFGPETLVGSDGAVATMYFSMTGTFSTTQALRRDLGSLPTTNQDANMMDGHIEATGTGTALVTISGLADDYNKFDVYVYVGDDAGNRNGELRVNGGAINNFTSKIFDGTYTVGTDYFLFEDLTGDTLTVAVEPQGDLGDNRTGIRGIQIISDGMSVASSDPANGAVLGVDPDTITLDFNKPVIVGTLDAEDLTVDGNAALSVTVDDDDTLTFDLPALSPGEHTIAIAAGAFDGEDGVPVDAYTATFTIADLPAVENVLASDINAVSARVGGLVTDTGDDPPQVTLYWGPTDGGTDALVWADSIDMGTQDDSFSTVIGDLVPLTTYYFRTFAENIAGEAWAPASASFATESVVPPTVVARPASGIQSSGARLNGEVLDTGNEPPTVTVFYGTSDGGTNPLLWDESVELGLQTGEFSVFVPGLTDETDHFFRARATNLAGSSWTAAASFTTPVYEPPRVVINELHVDPDLSTDLVEFVELFNASGETVDLSGWFFSNGLDYTFAPGASLGPNEYLVLAQTVPVELADQFEDKYGVAPYDRYVGKLSNNGERIVLRDEFGVVQDEVDYQIGFPWPTVGGAPGYSMELIDPELDNDLSGSWRASTGEAGDALDTLVTPNSDWNYFKGIAEPSVTQGAWRLLGFDDSTWLTDTASIGYGDGHVQTELADMRGTYSTVYFRKVFHVDDASAIGSLELGVQFDDGVNVWINGHHVFGENVADDELAFTDTAMDAGEDTSFRTSALPNPALYLVDGDNVIAVQLLNASLSDSSDAWFDAQLEPTTGVGAGPTPGAVNSMFATNAAPQMRQVDHSPNSPVSGQDVTITVKATDPNGVQGVTLDYQLVDPGSYIKLTDAAYETNWTTVTMHDDGLAGDDEAGDDVYSVVLPAALQTHRRLVRYRITATDLLGESITAPYSQDPQPNFAYFVYDGVPDWTGSLQPGVEPDVTYSSASLTTVPVYHLLANETDVNNSQYNGAYQWQYFHGTFVYDGEVYDHMEYRNRGRASVYQVGKNKWKMNFTRGHGFQARDPYGEKYAETWDKLTVLPGTNPWWRNDASTDGTVLSEPVAYKLYDLAGAPSPAAQNFHFRVVDRAEEASPTDQYEGDFWGLYHFVEQPDKSFLDARDLPDGDIFNMHGVAGANQRSEGSLTQVKQDADEILTLSEFVNGYNNTQTLQWWEDNLNFDAYFAWNAINFAINNSDTRPEENVNYYQNQETGQWYTVPWDLDLTFEDGTHWPTNWDNIDNVFTQHSSVSIAYEARVREILDLLLDNGDAALIVDEVAYDITAGASGDTIAEANQAMWDYHPRKRKPGIWYANFDADDLPTKTFDALVDYMKTFLTVGVDGFGYPQLAPIAIDANTPGTPTISYAGVAGFPSDGLTLETTAFADPQGAGTFAAIEWRVAEMHNPTVANYDPSEPYIYEIEGTWESGELTTFSSQIDVPATAVEVGRTYRARVRMQDDTGRWGHWSDAIEFQVTLPENAATADNLVVSEINFNPGAPTAAELAVDPTLDKDQFEFIELQNISGEVVSLANVAFAPGDPVEFSFDAAAINVLNPSEHVLVVRDQTAFELRYGAGHPIAGEFVDGGLSNGGEGIVLLGADGTPIRTFSYNDTPPWPVTADGLGFSLVLIDPLSNPDHANPYNWRASAATGGSPGAVDPAGPAGVLVNEALSNSDGALLDTIELFNPTAAEVNVGGWYLSDDADAPQKYQIPADTMIAAGGYLTFDESDFNASGGIDPGDFALSSSGDEVFLFSANPASGELTGYVHGFQFGAAANNTAFIHHVDSTGFEHFTAQADPGITLGQVNAPFRVGEVVITELHYNPNWSDPLEPFVDEFIELQNISGAAVPLYDPDNPVNTWKINGAGFVFPLGASVAPGEIALVVGIDPELFRAKYGLAPELQIFGPMTGGLSNGGERISLQRPGPPQPDASVPQIDVDVVDYDDAGAWPTAPDGSNGDGSSLTRLAADNFGSDPASWEGAEPTPGAAFTVRQIVGRHLFYNNSAYDTADDADAIAADKSPLALGQAATFANVSSFEHGINGLIIDLINPTATPVAGDFAFRVGSVDDTGVWQPAPPTASFAVDTGGGAFGATRVTITWADDAITGQWLETTVAASLTGTADVFYYGSAIGETGNDARNALVTAADLIAIRDNGRGAGNRAGITSPHDVNRDRLVNATDALLARNAATGPFDALRLITPTLPSTAPPEAEGAPGGTGCLSASVRLGGTGKPKITGGQAARATPIREAEGAPGGTGGLSASEHDANIRQFANTGGRAARAALRTPDSARHDRALGRRSTELPSERASFDLDNALADLLAVDWRRL